VDYDAKGKRSKISASKECSFYLGKQYTRPRFKITHLLIYTKSALIALLKELSGKEDESSFVEGVFGNYRVQCNISNRNE